MAALETIKGVMKTLFVLTLEEWNQMDKKFYRLLFGVISFIAMGLFWFYFLRNLIGF